jgi:hypothetical protein
MDRQSDEAKETPVPERSNESANERPVVLEMDELAPHVKVVRPTRPSLTYDRME